MNVKSSIFSLIALLAMPITLSYAKDFSQTHVINEDSDCANPNGNEVNRSVVIKAPDGMFFEKETVQVYSEPDMRSFTDAANPSGCFLRNAKTELLSVETKNEHEVKISVLSSFEVYGHSDCGSGEMRTLAHVSHGDRIRTDCSLKAQIYSRDDLK